MLSTAIDVEPTASSPTVWLDDVSISSYAVAVAQMETPNELP